MWSEEAGQGSAGHILGRARGEVLPVVEIHGSQPITGVVGGDLFQGGDDGFGVEIFPEALVQEFTAQVPVALEVEVDDQLVQGVATGGLFGPLLKGVVVFEPELQLGERHRFLAQNGDDGGHLLE